MGVVAYLFGEGYPSLQYFRLHKDPSRILSSGMDMTSSTPDDIDVILIRMRSINLERKVPHIM